MMFRILLPDNINQFNLNWINSTLLPLRWPLCNYNLSICKASNLHTTWDIQRKTFPRMLGVWALVAFSLIIFLVCTSVHLNFFRYLPKEQQLVMEDPCSLSNLLNFKVKHLDWFINANFDSHVFDCEVKLTVECIKEGSIELVSVHYVVVSIIWLNEILMIWMTLI